ncbi:MAG TPA: hypothetical protein VF857_10845, partial [Spirochaetota bacterium]
IRKMITFISFNMYALEELHRISGTKYRLQFIAATNRPLLGRFVVWRDRDLVYFDKKLIDQVRKADWLDGIWFEPRGIDHAAEIFNALNDRRKNKLGICVFTFGLPYKKFITRMNSFVYTDTDGVRRKLENVRSLVYDVQKFADKKMMASCD